MTEPAPAPKGELTLRISAELSQRWRQRFGLLAAVGGLLTLIGAAVDWRQFSFSYLTGFLFLASLGTGGVFWVVLHHLTDSGWSTVVRRPMEYIAAGAVPLVIFFLPVAIALTTLYTWTTADPAVDHLLAHKRPLLNIPFFLLRAAFFLGVWAWLGWEVRKWSLAQDEHGDAGPILRLRKISPVGMLLLALTTTYASIDWIMTLNHHWFSTIFGVYFWSGAILSSLAAVTLVSIALRKGLGLESVITFEHLHDLGKLLFGFTVFWAYIAFSQYFLIWYANLPEETTWYTPRIRGTWGLVALALLIGHFILPFFLLLFRSAKRNPTLLAIAAGWQLVFHWLDLHWQVLPNLHKAGVQFHWLDFAVLAFCVGTVGFIAIWSAGTKPVIPLRDPRLAESLSLHNL